MGEEARQAPSALSDTPELDKQAAAHDRAQAIGEFLEWLNSEGIHLCKWHEANLLCGCEHAHGDHLFDSFLLGRAECGEEGCTCEQYSARLRVAQYLSIHMSVERLLARYFDIDLDKIEQERRAILADLRNQQEGTDDETR